MDCILIRKNNTYMEYPAAGKVMADGKVLDVSEMRPFLWQEGCCYLPSDSKKYAKPPHLLIARDAGDITSEKFPFQILLEGGSLLIKCIEDEEREFFLNQQSFAVSREPMHFDIKEGDCFFADGLFVSVYERTITIKAEEGKYQINLPQLPKGQNEQAGNSYKRSPRLIMPMPGERIVIQKPPQKKETDKGSLIQMIAVPLVMLCITVAISIIMKRGLFVIMSIASTVMSLIASITQFVRSRREKKQYDEERTQRYGKYLLDMRKQLYHARKTEMDAYAYHYPDTAQIAFMIEQLSNRIYERSTADDDFLTFCAGYESAAVGYEIDYSADNQLMEQDELEQQALSLKAQFSMIDHKPVVLDLKRAHIGLVGEKSVIHAMLKNIVAQLAFFQSYHDLQIINIYSNEFNEEFAWMRWYPHLKIKAINIYGNINSEKMRDQIMGSVHQLLKERKQKLEEEKKESRFLPHYLFIMDEPKLIMDHSIMEYLSMQGDELGFSVIYTSYLRANLPENIGTVVMLEDSAQAVLLLNEKITENRRFTLPVWEQTDYEKMARSLARLVHEKGMVSHIPEKVGFLELYGAETPAQLQIEERWQKNESHKSLAVPLGLRAADDILYLNLHEKAHGPHGLVGGTTGSGKSEIVQSYILSLAVNFHPYEVGFLLIDYKGGGMAGLFKNMPHLLGTITNLDGSESMRAMASIKSELARRQRLFGENDVNHINGYSKLFKLGKVEEPIPHLFLISDEFAELKKEQPEFMTELVSAARIGRSLGIHLILATQKPGGVVDDQIWTNSRFKLALKVQSPEDSRELLKTPDAASITQPGRAYLQVGNNEIYELFQSAFSGGTYTEEMQEQETDDRVYLINALGQGELLNQDLSSKSDSNQIKATELDVIVDTIKNIYDSKNPIPVKKPWLPSLSLRMISPMYTLQNEVTDREHEEIPLCLSAELGLIDIPEEQRQVPFTLNLLKDGNTAFFAASGYGKSVFLTTMILSLALQNSVDNLNFYLCDFGNSALIPLNGLPHTADYIAMDDSERLGKLKSIIMSEIKNRKRMFAQAMVQNFDVYNQSNQDNRLKAIVVVIDNYDVIKDIGPDEEDFYTRLSRDGVSLGIYMVITATRLNAVRYAALNNYRNKLAGYLFDETEHRNIIGKCAYSIPEAAGRAYVKQTNVNIMQIYSMVPFKNEVEYNSEIKGMVQKLKQMFPTKRAPRIPVLPEQLTFSMLKDYAADTKAHILLGLHKETVEARGITPGATPFIIAGDSGKGKTNLLKVILEQVKGDTFIFDSRAKELYYASDRAGVHYLEDEDDMEDFMADMKLLVDNRVIAFKKAQLENKQLSPKEFYATMPPCYILIDNVDECVEQWKEGLAVLGNLFRQAAETGIYVIATMHSSKQKGLDDITKWFKTAVCGILVGAQGTLSNFTFIPLREQPAFGDGCLCSNGTYERLLLPKYEDAGRSMEQ